MVRILKKSLITLFRQKIPYLCVTELESISIYLLLMIDFMMGYKSTFNNLLFVFIVAFLMQYFYNLMQLRYNIEILTENKNKQLVSLDKESDKIEKKAQVNIEPEKIPKRKPIRAQPSCYSAGSIIDPSLHSKIVVA